MRIFKDVGFSRFARRQNISDSDLCEAVERAERGLVDADLGGGVIKQRIPRPNESRSSGFRTIIFFRVEERAFFVFGFAKNERDNISTDDLKAFRQAAQVALHLEEETLEDLIEKAKLIEVNCDEEDL